MSIQDVTEKIKRLLADEGIFTAILIMLIGVASFGLGRQSVPSVGHLTAKIEAPVSGAGTFESSPVKESNIIASSTIEYVASKNGEKYHLPWCSGAKRIIEANKIYFSSREEAESAGYTPAANCKGLSE